jgi:hypothetical protein
MRTILITIALAGACLNLHAQNISAIKYWFDNDLSNGSTVPRNYPPNALITENLPTNDLPTGFHSVSVMFMQGDGKWSIPMSESFFKISCSGANSGYQYWFDNDTANRRFANFQEGSDVSYNIPIGANLTQGFHKLNIRFRPQGCLWSNPISENFYYTSGDGISQLEFWFDSAYTQKQVVSIPKNEQLIISEANLNALSLKNGMHQLNIRYKPLGGTWSTVQSEMLFKRGNDIKPNLEISSYNYVFDEDFDNPREIKLSGLPGETLLSNIPTEFLNTGSHKIGYQVNDNGKIASVSIVDSFVRIPIKNYFLLKPKVALSGSRLSTPSAFRVSGKDFYPLSRISIYLKNNAGIVQDTFARTNIEGKFSITLSTNNTYPTGDYLIFCKDSATGNFSNIQKFEIINSQIEYTPSLVLISPEYNAEVKEGYNINIIVNEKIVSTSDYIINNSISKRAYKYIIYTSSDSINWTPSKTIEGFAKISSLNIVTDNIIANNAGISYILVKDAYKIQNAAGTKIEITPSSKKKFDIKLNWDYSFGKDNVRSIDGVCADGTARIFLDVTKKDNVSIDITKTRIEILAVINPAPYTNYTSTSLLGKCMAVADCSLAYNTEANNASGLSAELVGPNCQNIYKFWYVAPDDFNNGESLNFYNAQRYVKIKVITQWSTGIEESDTVSIKIVRPPLVFVHGVASDPETWDKFSFEKNGNSTNPFLLSSTFPFKKAIKLNPSGSFDENGWRLIGKNHGGINDDNNLIGIINKTRREGYACNRVDYVAHSMGGIALRIAATTYVDFFKGTNDVYPYRNYEKGFVNKFITIGTPHNSSPLADILNKTVGSLNYKSRVFISGVKESFDVTNYFIEPVDENDLTLQFKFRITPAVRDMQVFESNGGINLPNVTGIRNHLIATKLFASNSIRDQVIANDIEVTFFSVISYLVEESIYTEILSTSKSIADFFDKPEARKALKAKLKKLINIASRIDRAQKTAEYIEYVNQINNFESIFINSDLVVPSNSQLAGLPENAPNVTLFTGSGKPHHLSQTSSIEIGNRVIFLLNSPIATSLFGLNIPSTTNQPEKQGPTFLTTFDSTLIEPIYDTTKFKINAFDKYNCNLLHLDSTLKITLINSKPDSVLTSKIDFLNQSHSSSAKSDSIAFNVQIGNFYTKETILYASCLIDSAGIIKEYYDSILICFAKPVNIQSLNLYPNSYNVSVGDKFIPQIYINSDSSKKQINQKSLDLNIYITDTSIAKTSNLTRMLVAKKPGATMVVFDFYGYKDTIFIYVDDTITAQRSLPIILSNFTSKTKDCKTIAINWQTSQEVNNYGFEIEKSSDGINFTKLDFIKGTGNSDKVTSYSYSANNLSNGIFFWRLKQLDYDGKYSYSKIISSTINCRTSDLSVTPNPAEKNITIQGLNTSKPHDMQIIDSKGSVVRTLRRTYLNFINIEELSTGTYFIKIDNKDYVKFVKQ